MTGNSDDTIIWLHYSFLLHCNKKQTKAGFHMVSQIIMWRDSQHLHHVLHLYPYIHSPSAENQDVWVHLFATHITSRYSHVFHIYISYHQFLATPLKINRVHLKFTQLKSGKLSEPNLYLILRFKMWVFQGVQAFLLNLSWQSVSTKKTSWGSGLANGCISSSKTSRCFDVFEVAGFLIGFHDDFRR